MTKRKYALMLFETEISLGISSNPGLWENTKTLYFDNGAEALYYYSEIPNPASCLLDGETEEELHTQVEQMKRNYKDRDWLDKNLYPYL